MSELMGTLLTYLPLLIIFLLANLAERARERATKQSASQTVAPWDAREAEDALLLSDAEELDPFSPFAGTHIASGEGGKAVQTPVERSDGTANASDGTIFAALAYLALVVTYGLLLLTGMGILAAASMPALSADMGEVMGTMNTPLLGWGLVVVSLLGCVVLLRPVRRMLARVLPIDPLSTVHAVSLSMIALVVAQLVFVMGVGIANLADMMTQTSEGADSAVSVLGVWFGELMMALLGAVGVGWLVRRSGRATLQRLGIVMPTAGQAIASILLGLVMAGVIMAVEALSVAAGWGLDEDVGRLTEQMLGGLMMSIPGVLTLGLAAGIGEETLMRGAVQPRMGLVLTSVIFALLHANYGITLSTLAVLILGFVLGLVRIRYNTTSAMLLHATYNITFGLIAYFSMANM